MLQCRTANSRFFVVNVFYYCLKPTSDIQIIGLEGLDLVDRMYGGQEQDQEGERQIGAGTTSLQEVEDLQLAYVAPTEAEAKAGSEDEAVFEPATFITGK